MISGERVVARFLGLGTFWKILLANVLVAGGAVMLAPAALRGLQPEASALAVLVLVAAITLVVNAVLLRLALAPLTELERAAERVAAGELQTRARLTPLADGPLAALTRTFNRMVESLETQRQLGRHVAFEVLADADEARRRLSRDLRDDSAQVLISALLRLRGIKALDDPDARERALDEVRASLTEVIERLRTLAGELQPSGLDLLGVDQVIESYATATAREKPVRVTVTRESLRGALAPEAETELLRIVEEIVDRAIAQARSRVQVAIHRVDGCAAVTVQRDGNGSVLPAEEDRLLFASRERASYFGGRIDVYSADGERSVRVRFPLTPGT